MMHAEELFLFQALLLLKMVSSQNLSAVEPLPELQLTCPESCHRNIDKFSNTEATNDSCLDASFLEPSYQTKLPKCKQVTVKRQDFFISERNDLVLQRNGLEAYIHDYRLAEDNQTADICYILSPQLQNCNLKLLDRRLYVYNESLLALKNCKTKQNIALSDFYVLPDSKGIVGCNESLGYDIGLQRRCEYINLSRTEYEFLDGNTTIRLLPSNRTIYQALYEPGENLTHIRMCFPLNAKMTKCTIDHFYSHQYTKEADYRIYHKRYRNYINLGDYQTNPSTGGIAMCRDTQEVALDHYIYYYCYLIQILSAVLLILAIIIHLIFPSINYHAKPLLCQMFSMTTYYIVGAYRFLWYPETVIGCYTVFGILYYSLLTSFFWLNVLSFDLWSIFANLQTSSWHLGANLCANKPKFLLYCAYAYPIPLVMTILSIVLETQPSVQNVLNLRPDIQAICWFTQPKSLNALYFGPVFFLLCVNVVLFGLTVCNLRNASEGVTIVNKERNKQLFFVCVKIFVITGLCWNLQFIANLTGERIAKYISFSAVSIQGILLFIIYICKKSTYKILKRKLRRIQTRDQSLAKNHDPVHSTSSGISMESVINDDNSPQEKNSRNNSTGIAEHETTSI